MATTSNDQVLRATYSSPTNDPFTHISKMPSSNGTALEKTAYLAALRAAAVTMQERINTELTARMEEDKALEASILQGKGIDEAKEEDNYGEEVAEED